MHPTGVVLLGSVMSLGLASLLPVGGRSVADAAPPPGDVPAAHDPAAPAARTANIVARVRKVVARQLEVDPRRVTESARFREDLGADDLDGMELVMAFEEEFDVTIPEDLATHLETVGDAVRLIEGCKQTYSVMDTRDCQTVLLH